jgi:large subunit ribosomal protein L18
MSKTQKKRKQERKTSYKKRFGMLKSEKARIVIRKTNKYLSVQYVESDEARDKVIFGVSSKDLLKQGWPKELEGSLKSLSASYLTGYLFGKTAVEKKVEIGIVDIGLQRNIHKGRIYAVLKGIVDAGFDVPHKESVFPSQDRIEGKHLKEPVMKAFEQVREKIK